MARGRRRGPGYAPSSSRAGVRAEFVAGLRFFRSSRFLIVLLTIAVIGQLGMGSLNTLNVFFLTDNLGAPSELYGYLGTAMGVGAILGALAAGWVVEEYTGRVLAVFYPMTQLASMLAAAASGWLASSELRDFTASIGGVRLGPIDSIFAVASALIVVAGVYAHIALPRTEDKSAAVVDRP